MNATTPIAPLSGNGRIRVLQVVGNAIVGGMESWVERLVERLPRERFEFTALCPFESPFTDRLRALDVDVAIAPMADDPSWSTIQTAAVIVAGGGVDLLHAHLPRAHVLAGIVGRITSRPVVSTIHGRQLTTLDLEVHRTAGTHLSVVCRQTYYHALALGVSAGHLSCETNGVDVQVFQPRPRGAAGLRTALGLAADAPLVGFVGRLSPEKGPDVLVRAALVLQVRCPTAHIVFVGEGPMEGDLQALAQRLGLQDCVHFIGLRTDMPAVYAELDIVVSCSHSEAMPLALMEAMASAVPTVATAVGGVPEMVEHGQTGWLVAPGDFDDIAGRCEALLASPERRRTMGDRARARAIERMNLDASVERVGALLARLARPLGEAPRRSASVASVVGTPRPALAAGADPPRRATGQRSGAPAS